LYGLYDPAAGGQPPLIVKRLGRVEYEPTFAAMQEFTASRDERTPDELWIVEHHPVYTLGQAGKPEHVLLAGDIPVIRCNRGGQVTYHGPGQIVAYPLLDIRRLGLGVRELVHRIEQALIDTLAHWDISAARRPGAPGVYVGPAKIAALGLRVKHGCSLHGLAFNIDMDLAPFRRINPCGYQGLEVTSVLELGGPGELAAVKPVLVEALSRRLGLQARFEPGLPDLLPA